MNLIHLHMKNFRKGFFLLMITGLCCGVMPSLFGQQPSPIGIIFNPRVNTFAISGVGGGNIYEFSAEKSSTSGQLAADWNIGLGDKKTKKGADRFQTLGMTLKYNPFLKSNFIGTDSLEMRKLAFIDNEFAFILGMRFSDLSLLGNDKSARFRRTAFLDFSLAPYQVADSVANESGFYNFNVNLGYQIGLLTNTDFGIVGGSISPQVNFISIYDTENGGQAFESLARSSTPLARTFIGGGLKLMVPMNDFVFFFDARRYWSLNSGPEVPGLSDRMIFSFGGIATGTVFKNKTEENR